MKILLIGSSGQVGWELKRTLATLGEIFAPDEHELDLAATQRTREVVREFRPNVIVNAAAYNDVEKAETDTDLVMTINGVTPGVLAEEAHELGAVLIHYSTDYVFDGGKGAPYTEQDIPNPINVYGHSKLAGDRAIRDVGGSYLILRTSWVYSMRSRRNFMAKVLHWAREQRTVRVVDDQVSSPTWCRLIAESTAQILSQGIHDLMGFFESRTGLYHIACAGFCSRYQWAQVILEEDPHHEEQIALEVLPAKTKEFPSLAKRPKFSALNCDLLSDHFGIRLPEWKHGLRLALHNANRDS